MVLGQAATKAAVLTIDQACIVPAIDVQRLCDRLAADGQILAWDRKYNRIPTAREGI